MLTQDQITAAYEKAMDNNPLSDLKIKTNFNGDKE